MQLLYAAIGQCRRMVILMEDCNAFSKDTLSEDSHCFNSQAHGNVLKMRLRKTHRLTLDSAFNSICYKSNWNEHSYHLLYWPVDISKKTRIRYLAVWEWVSEHVGGCVCVWVCVCEPNLLKSLTSRLRLKTPPMMRNRLFHRPMQA